jgi:hypothetical protein
MAKGHLDDEQRVPTELEEVVSQPDPGSSQQAFPKRDQRLLLGARDRAFFLDPGLGFQHQIPESPAIDLSVRQAG